MRLLPHAFFSRRPDAVAIDLLGKLLIRLLGEQRHCARVVEVEAYLGADDPAAHAFRGRTPRNAVLFGAPGRAYVYFSYGMHHCLNVSTQPVGQAGCVLIRALQPEPGGGRTPSNRRLLPSPTDCLGPRDLSGPGRLTRVLAIDRTLNGQDLTRRGPLYLADDGMSPRRIAITRRIGISRAAERPLRFYIEDAAAVSSPRGPILEILEMPAPGRFWAGNRSAKVRN